jgi:hypothetical protein
LEINPKEIHERDIVPETISVSKPEKYSQMYTSTLVEAQAIINFIPILNKPPVSKGGKNQTILDRRGKKTNCH